MKILLVAGLLSVALQAQVATSRALRWSQGPEVGQSAITVAQVQAYTYLLAIDAAPAAPLVQTCALVNGIVACSAPLPTLSPGAHTLMLTVDNGFGTATAILSGASPSQPINLSVTVTVIVN